MSNITLKKIDESNFIDCFSLKLAMWQEKYVSHPMFDDMFHYQIAKAQVFCHSFKEYAVSCICGAAYFICGDSEEDMLSFFKHQWKPCEKSSGRGRGLVQERLVCSG